MNIFNKLGAFFMSLFFKYNVETVTGIKSNISAEMADKIDLWNAILSGRAPWLSDIGSCGITEATIGKLQNAVGEELDVMSENEPLDKVMKKLNENAKELIQNMVAIGGSIVRPVFANNKMQYEIIKLGNYIPTGYDLDGTLTSCIITKKIDEGDKSFLLVERHEYKNNTHSVNCELFKIAGDSLKKTSLEACSYTAGITPAYAYSNVKKPFIVEFRNRIPNKVDGSNIPCAIWQNTENLIKDADEQYNRITWEQEGGEMRVFADEDLFKSHQTKKGEKPIKRLDPKLNKLVVQLSGNGLGDEKITEHAPNLRTPQQVEAFNVILRRCELAWNIGKGTLSDLEAVQQTATQYAGGKREFYNFIDSIESELEEKYKDLAYIFAYMISAYTGAKFDDSITITYNDAARKDAETMRQAAIIEVQNKIISPAEYRERIFGEDAETAAEKVPDAAASNTIGLFDMRG